MSQAAMTDHLSAAKVQRILLVLLVVAAPHFSRMPLWATALVLGLGIWRAFAAQRTWAMPKPWIRHSMSVAAFAGIWVQFQTLNGHYAGVALLTVMLGLKLTEMTRRRDYLLVIYLSYFLLITHFLFSQEMAMLLLLFAGAWAITNVLVDINHPQSVLPMRQSVRISGTLLLQALPLMLIFFVLFPRIPGPLWGLPSDAGKGLTGLPESLSPGDISNLSLSDEVAFRVRFQDQVPARRDMYWRGPVFEFFNGRSWVPGAWNEIPRKVSTELLSDPIEYEIQLEAHGKKWLLALDVPIAPLPAESSLGPDLVLRSNTDIVEKRLYKLSAVTNFKIDTDASDVLLQRHLSLPSASNPQAKQLAAQWRAEYEQPSQIVSAALQHFRQQPFSYTLRPPLMRGRNNIDEFLFDTQRGFCGHFAGSFTFLMRAAGIPARIVTGYQGAEANGDYYIVRQSDAHAWSEVWLEQRGWVRVDPTAAVAPDRIERGLGASMPAGEPVPGLARMNRNALRTLRLKWDRVNALWNRWVLAYGPELQQSLLAALGLPGLRELLIALTVLTVGSLLLVGYLVNRGHRSLEALDPVQREWQRYKRKLKKIGVASKPSEGPQDLHTKLSAIHPEWAEEASKITQIYVRLRYASNTLDQTLLRRLRQRIRQFPHRKASST